MAELPQWQTHRFRDVIAVCIGTGETVYMTTKQARALSGGINAACRSVEREQFADSRGLTRSGEGLDSNAPLPTCNRLPCGKAVRYTRLKQ